ncbi:MAG: DUF4124 domain-containing protein [Pseudomonas sp.]|uniref:DUF4124 domain-containing protein n=1 Tax=Pseudomonas abieticivorans TaxID=2931382 RepID=UPI0020BFDBF1|nr:DUF4124 domain-containing protein [Pseudomonas sp. PIA16]MDE1168178.1 DUF4124 domain-containing protein [Pseudomonas sp.]
MTRLLLAACITWLSLSLPANGAEVFTYVDANGNRVFTDQPHSNAKKVQIAESNSMSPAQLPQKVLPKPKRKPVTLPLQHYQMLRILIPEPDATVQAMSGDFIVTVTSDPGLQPGHGYRLLLDGNVVAGPGVSPVFQLKNVDRGRHQLSAEIIDAQENVIERTPPQPFQMQRTSLAQKRKARPCKTADYGVRPECPIADKPADADE